MKKNNENDNNLLYSKLEKGGMNYIKKEEKYLFISTLFPIFSIIIQVLNLGFILYLEFNKPVIGPGSRGPLLIDILTPIIITSVITIFALINSLYLIQWKKKVRVYEIHEAPGEEINDISSKNVSLTQIFYDIVRNMERIRIIFVILNIFCAYYLIWYLTFFVIRRDSVLPPQPIPIQHVIVEILNIIFQIALILYLIYEWIHFYQWNKKLSKLKTFEKKIFDELDL